MKKALLILVIAFFAKTTSYSQDTVSYVTSNCLYELRSGLYNGSVLLGYSADTLTIFGEIAANCGASHIAIYERKNDTLYISTKDTGLMTTCYCMFHFEIKIKINQSDSIIRFNGDLYKNGVYRGLNKINFDSDRIQLTPNPTDGFIRVDKASNILVNNIKIFDVSGRLIAIQTLKQDKINITGLSSGLYLLLFDLSGGNPILKRIIKK